MAKHSILMTIPFLVAIIVASPATTASSTLPATIIVASPATTASSTLPATTAAPPPPAPAANSSTPTAYDMHEKYNLARGILPEGVTGYILNPDGSFEVYFPADCNIRAGGMNVRYNSIVKGNIRSQSISELQGVHVEVAFVWIDITEVNASDGQLHFVAGPISKSFPVDKFSNSPQCN